VGISQKHGLQKRLLGSMGGSFEFRPTTLKDHYVIDKKFTKQKHSKDNGCKCQQQGTPPLQQADVLPSQNPSNQNHFSSPGVASKGVKSIKKSPENTEESEDPSRLCTYREKEKWVMLLNKSSITAPLC
jgi:hypothetical protein